MNAQSPTSFTKPDRMEQDWEALREECELEFEDWQRADYAAREFEDFSSWLVRKASWNRPNAYEAALDWRERSRLERQSS